MCQNINLFIAFIIKQVTWDPCDRNDFDFYLEKRILFWFQIPITIQTYMSVSCMTMELNPDATSDSPRVIDTITEFHIRTERVSYIPTFL